MNKKEIIVELRKFNPLRTMSSWNRMEVSELQKIYDEGVGLGVIIPPISS